MTRIANNRRPIRPTRCPPRECKGKTRQSRFPPAGLAQALRTSSPGFGARDKPDANRSENETEYVPIARKALGESSHNCWNRGTENRRHRRNQSHLPGGQGAVEQGQSDATNRSGNQRPSQAGIARKWRVGHQRKSADHDQAAEVHDGREQKRIHAP